MRLVIKLNLFFILLFGYPKLFGDSEEIECKDFSPFIHSQSFTQDRLRLIARELVYLINFQTASNNFADINSIRSQSLNKFKTEYQRLYSIYGNDFKVSDFTKSDPPNLIYLTTPFSRI